MATVKMMQGDSYAVFVALRFRETREPITPDMISDVEIHVGDSLRKTYSSGEVMYDEDQKQWYFIPSQQETFALDPDGYKVQARIKFRNGQHSAVRGIDVGTINIDDAHSEEVI